MTSSFALKRIAAVMLAAMTAGIATPAGAVIDPTHQFIVNGDFEQTTAGLGQLRHTTNVVGWTSRRDVDNNNAFTYVLNTSTASSTGSPGEGQLKLWGPGNGQNNGLTSSPTGGNFIGADGGYHIGKLTQTITGLIVGQSYQLTFNYAGAQEYGWNAATNNAWLFGFENQGLNSQTTGLATAAKGFSGWSGYTYNFVATQATDTLYFLAKGTPTGQPPFSLLDSVSLVGGWENGVSAAPDSSTWMTMLLGFGIVGSTLRINRRRTLRVQIA